MCYLVMSSTFLRSQLQFAIAADFFLSISGRSDRGARSIITSRSVCQRCRLGQGKRSPVAKMRSFFGKCKLPFGSTARHSCPMSVEGLEVAFRVSFENLWSQWSIGHRVDLLFFYNDTPENFLEVQAVEKLRLRSSSGLRVELRLRSNSRLSGCGLPSHDRY